MLALSSLGAPATAFAQATAPPAEQAPAPQAPAPAATSAAVQDSSKGPPIEVVVTAARRPERIDAVPASVTVISREQIKNEVALSNGNLGDALGRLVPGMGLGSQTQSSFGQTIRGRKVLVLIDGIPQHTIRNVSRDFQTLSALAVERIEVIRGTTPLYGEGAAGGIINIITRRRTVEGTEFMTDVSLGAAPRNFADGLSGSIAQAVNGMVGPLSYSAQATLEKTTGLFDAEGDRIPPDPHGQGGLADMWAWSALWRVGVRMTPAQRIELAASYYQNVQDTEYTTDPAVSTDPPGTVKARAKPGLELEDQQRSRNVLASASYRHVRVLGGDLGADLYFRNYVTRFYPFDGRKVASYKYIIQSELDSQKLGGRIQLNTPLPFRLRALYGVDVSGESTEQAATIIDPNAYDASGGLVFDARGYRTWVPRMMVGNLAPFVQLQWDATKWLSLRAGVREELITLSVDDYTTLTGNDIKGGRLSFAKTLLHAGTVLTFPAHFSAFFSFMQGYALPDVGLLLRNAPAASTLDSLNSDPQAVNAFEAGIRREGEVISGSFAGFYNTSDLGVSSGGFSAPVVRAPERVYGVEATLDARFFEKTLRIGSGVSWLEGELDKEDNGNWTYLNTHRIPPLKISMYIGKRFFRIWDIELRGVYSGARDRFSDLPKPGFGERAVEPYFVMDLLTSLDIGPGTLRAGVSNLLNHQYAPITSQLLYSGTNTSNAAAPGTRVTLGYSFKY